MSALWWLLGWMLCWLLGVGMTVGLATGWPSARAVDVRSASELVSTDEPLPRPLRPQSARLEALPLQPAPGMMLASPVHAGIDVGDYWISEKLDGVRARWDGRRLVTRGGARVSVPAWFVRGWPSMPLDGELWLGRGRFEATSGVVRRYRDDDAL